MNALRSLARTGTSLAADVLVVSSNEEAVAGVRDIGQSFHLERRRESDGVWLTRITNTAFDGAQQSVAGTRESVTVEQRDDEETPRAFDSAMRAIPNSPELLVRAGAGTSRFSELRAMPAHVARGTAKAMDRGFGGLVVEPARQAALLAFLQRQGARASRTSRGSELYSFSQSDLRIVLEIEPGSNAILDEAIWRGAELLSHTRRQYMQYGNGSLVETYRLTEVSRPKASGGRLRIERTLMNVVLTGSGS